MARSARNKELFSTYLIEQQCSLKHFDAPAEKDAFIDALCQAIKQYGCLIVGCELTADRYRLIIYDNGNDISSIMRSINISFSMQAAKQKLFRRRFKSTLLADDTAISRHLGQFDALGNKYQRALSKANELVNSSGFRRRLFKNDDSFCDFIKAQRHTLPCLTAPCHRKRDDDKYCMDSAAVKVYLANLLKCNHLTLGELKADKKMRKAQILYLRKHSNLTLKQLGDLFGIAESSVSKLIKRSNTTKR